MKFPGKGIKNVFTGGPGIDLPEFPTIPVRGDAAAPKAARKDEEAIRRRRGRRQTQLTGGTGVEGEAPVKRKTLGA